MKTNLIAAWVASVLSFVGCSCTHGTHQMDEQSAIEGNDLTAILSGCGQQLAGSGYLVCRQMDGQSTHGTFLFVHTPPDLDCEDDVCTYVKVFFPDGRPALEMGIRKGQSLSLIPWADLLGKEVFGLSDRGFYAVSVTAHYLGPDHLPRKTYAMGLVLMHVVRSTYTSLQNSREDESFRWIWQTDHGQVIKVTSGYRVFVEPSTGFLNP